MSAPYIPRLSWEAAFLDTLAKTGNISRSVNAAGISRSTVNGLRDRNPAFSQEYDRLKQRTGNSLRAPAPSLWKRLFLEKLAETSNVSASAKKADVPVTEVYKTRRENAAFAAQWQAALYEGYLNLEMEVLGYLRDPKPANKIDVANALRLLAAHKESAAKEMAVRSKVSAADISASIERKVEAMRKQVAARRAQEKA